MFRPLQGIDSSISIGRIERRYESLQIYDTNIFVFDKILPTQIITMFTFYLRLVGIVPRFDKHSKAKTEA